MGSRLARWHWLAVRRAGYGVDTEGGGRVRILFLNISLAVSLAANTIAVFKKDWPAATYFLLLSVGLVFLRIVAG
jgi:hypothetical protein